MTFQQELASWNPFTSISHVQPVPELGVEAPSVSKLQLPRPDGKPVVIAFLRHCGCPFAEKVLMSLRELAKDRSDIHFVAVSHSDDSSTSKWLDFVGGSGSVEVVVDDQKEIYAAYGLGASSFWAVLNPWSLSNVIKLGKAENIWNRPTESGSRWQTAGLFSVDGQGKLAYSHPSGTADDLGDLESAVEAVKQK